MLCLIFCCGCWDKHELEDHTFVIMLGLDKTPDGNVQVTAAFPVTQTESGGAQDSGQFSVISAQAPTVSQAKSLFGIKLAGPLSFFSTKTLVISEDLARDDMLRHLFSSGLYEQLRNNTNVMISKSGAAEFISARIENPAIDPLRQEDLLLEQANESANYRPMQLLDFMAGLRSNNMDAAAMYGGVLPKDKEGQSGSQESAGEEKNQDKSGNNATEITQPVKIGYLPGQAPIASENTTQISGLAVFRGDRMVGALDSFETQTLNMMLNSQTRKILALPDPFSPDDVIVVSIFPTKKSRIRASIVEDTPHFDINVFLRCTLEHIRKDAGYDQNLLAEYIKQACAQNMQSLIEKLQKEFGADLLGLGNRLARNFFTIQQWDAFNWRERYPDAQININVSLDMERTGI